MMRAIGCGVLTILAAIAQAQSPPENSRGDLLYTTHCVGCHTTEVHWREKKLVSDWASLNAQVERWQKNAKLGWSGEDVDAVARHLNARVLPSAGARGKARRRTASAVSDRAS